MLFIKERILTEKEFSEVSKTIAYLRLAINNFI